MIKFLFGLVATVVVLVVIGFLTLCWVGLAIGSANAWILEGTFSDGWDAVWDRWLPAVGWALIFVAGISVVSGSK